MSEALLSSIIDKLDVSERKLDELIERLEHSPNYTTTLNQIENKVGLVATCIQRIGIPQKEMQELTEMIATNIDLMQHPIKQEIRHHHHATKTIWIAAALFLIVCMEGGALYKATNNLQQYKANDTKYRYLKLQDNSVLNKLLSFTDSLYAVSATMHDGIIAREEENQKKLEMLRRAIQLEKEARELKKKVNAKDKPGRGK